MNLQLFALIFTPVGVLLLSACNDLPNCEQFTIASYEQIAKIDIPPVATSDCREEGDARLTIFQLDTISDIPWRRFGTMESFLGRYNLQVVSASSLADHFPLLAGDPRLPTEGRVYFKSSLRDEYRYKVALLPDRSILIVEVSPK